ncbi:MAG: uroporphyrinogen decarboxylase [Candidatus Reconcilbacillus cellulovorans]|uniref:Uroporphyrinogen decarboxylase n=1 Tax=Candidatus Reconcilbacillus cellulovorans TaxID=1906605 RepID=A0A2A6E1W1_9BACL|nr:MAG: uroporphyrinogen decarboxylase [Candidatus Reconcilbacillus cellulovorans]
MLRAKESHPVSASEFNDTFLKACRREPTDYAPVWFMRQAGRYDPEYRRLKERYSLMDICRNPELAAEVTAMPVRKLGVDAAILYSDIMNPVSALGVAFTIVKDVGPVVHRPVRTADDVRRLRPFSIDGDLERVLDTIRILDRELRVPLIGFAGAPFTIASYLVEGRPTRQYLRTKAMMYGAPDVWRELLDKLADMAAGYLRAQLECGADAVQLFDSWAGALSPADFRAYVLPAVRKIFDHLADCPQPKIYYPGVGSGELLPELRGLKCDVVSVDWRVSIREARRRTGGGFAVQGNLDPAVLLAPLAVVERTAASIIDEGLEEPGFVFNLGHGLFPEAPFERVRELVAFVHEYSRKKAGAPRISGLRQDVVAVKPTREVAG